LENWISTDEWGKKVWYLYTMEYYAAREGNYAYRKMDGTGDHVD
jgi:hypothetical protein